MEIRGNGYKMGVNVYITGQMRSGTSLVSSYIEQQKNCRCFVDQYRINSASKIAFPAGKDMLKRLNLQDRSKLFLAFINVTLLFARGEKSRRIALDRVRPFSQFYSRIDLGKKPISVAPNSLLDIPHFSNHVDLYDAVMDIARDPSDPAIEVMSNKETRGEPFAVARSEVGAKSIIVQRDPRAVVSSFVKRVTEDKTFGVRGSMEEATELWLEGYRHAQRSSRSFVLRYEDFILEHREQVRRLADYLDVELEADLPPAVNNSSFGDVAGATLSTSGIDRWRTQADEELVSFVTERCRPEIEALGYKI